LTQRSLLVSIAFPTTAPAQFKRSGPSNLKLPIASGTDRSIHSRISPLVSRPQRSRKYPVSDSICANDDLGSWFVWNRRFEFFPRRRAAVPERE
jgi:hypothetical protein